LAEQGGQEKTEQPTSKRRSDARKKGQVFQSKDIVTVIMLYGVFWMIRKMVPYIHTTINAYMVWIINSISAEPELMLNSQLYGITVTAILKCVLPLLLTAMVLGIIAHGVQTKFNVSFESIKPKFSKLNPISGIKNMFSLKKVFELVKNLIKITLLLALLYNLLKDDIAKTAKLIDIGLLQSAAYMLQMSYNLVVRVCMVFAVVSFFDYLFQRWQFEQDLKMTKQEVKEEHKNTEGNPEIKGRIRSIQRQMAMSRMMQKVPDADVIIKNPTHFAVALKYDPDKHGAPVVLAKGQDELALRIIKAGEEHGIFVTENQPLARALYAICEIGREIPAEFYGAIAEILVYIYKSGNRDDMFQ